MQEVIAEAEAVTPLTICPPLLAAMRRRLMKTKSCYFLQSDIRHSLLVLAIGKHQLSVIEVDWLLGNSIIVSKIGK